MFSFANNINTVDGGTHLTGFRSALTRTLNDYARKAGLLKENDANLTGDDVREGLTAIISVKLPEPQFEGQTKGKLGNAEVTDAGRARGHRGAAAVPGREPADGKRIIEKCLNAARARDAARKARELVHPQGRAGRHDPARQAGRLLGARPGAVRVLHRRGRLGRRQRQAGPRPPLPGDPAAARQDPQRRAARLDKMLASERDPSADHGAGHRHRRDVRPRASCATTASSS